MHVFALLRLFSNLATYRRVDTSYSKSSQKVFINAASLQDHDDMGDHRAMDNMGDHRVMDKTLGV